MLYPKHFVGQALWLYYRFSLSHRDIEDLLAERGIIVTRESIRLWCIKFGALCARILKRKHRELIPETIHSTKQYRIIEQGACLRPGWQISLAWMS